MTRFTGHCRGCNQDFPAAETDRCPQCGELLTVAVDRPTITLCETIAGAPKDVADDLSSDELHHLIGSQLSLYSIEGLLGRGGMAWVFQARHNMLQRPCAIKILSPDLERRQPGAVESFLREARVAASLVHPHVVTVHNIGHHDGYHFIEMEYVPGQSLQHLFAVDGLLPPTQATDYVLQSCSALAEAHRQGMIHRDFKPANILVRNDGWTKLADFGLAKRVVALHGESDRSLSGTPYFMAPELFCGSAGTCASDVYAVGVSYFYLLTGRFPYTDRSITRLAQLHQQAPVPDPREHGHDIPDAAVEVVRQALAKEPADRFRDGAELYSALREISTSLRSLQSIVTEAIDGIDATLRAADDVLEIVVSLPNGRRQKIYVEETVSQPWSAQIVRVYSVCGLAIPSYFRRALELNARVPHGSLAVESIDGDPHFVMLNSHLRVACDPIDIRHSVLDIAQWADDMEAALTGQDLY